jgi:5-bromo-4-chloroindolyl phosphate hydrolysis protein
MFHSLTSFFLGTLFILLLIIPFVLLLLSPLSIMGTIVIMVRKFLQLKKSLAVSKEFLDKHSLTLAKDSYAVFQDSYKGIMTDEKFEFLNPMCTSALVSKEMNIYSLFVNSMRPSLVGVGMKTTQYKILSLSIEPTKQHIYVRSETNQHLVNVKGFFDNNQLYEAEGDMYQYFDFFFPDDAEVESLVLFGPDTMFYILENMANVDIEIRNDKLIIYAPSLINDEAQLKKFIDKTRALASELNPRFSRKVTPKVASRPTGIITPRKLTRHMPVFLVAFFAVPLLLFPFIFIDLLIGRWTTSVFLKSVGLLCILVGFSVPYFFVARYYLNKQKARSAKKRHRMRYGKRSEV